MNNFEVIIGIENHVELKTKTKIFSPGSVSFSMSPNTCANERDLGYPGTLPNVNKECVKLAILACNAFSMKIDDLLRFDRKNYFYSDLAKGFQITQQFFPIGSDGTIEIEIGAKSKKISIERLHLEEDTAKQIHDIKTKIDYNRSGIGLIEVVSKPELRSAEEAVAYVSKLREILLFLNVSDVKMNEGSLRCDVNISLRPINSKILGNKVEIKNLNSLNNVAKSIEFEIKRQTKLLLDNQIINCETRRFDESLQETVQMRSKGDAMDYKYFREPNIFPIKLDKNWIKEIIKLSPELAHQKRERYIKKYSLTNAETEYILQDLNFVYFFEKTVLLGVEGKKVANILINDIKDQINRTNIKLENSKITPNQIFELFSLQDKKIISSKHIKQLISILFENEISLNEAIEKNDYKLISDPKIIENFLINIIKKNLDFIKNEYIQRPQRVEKTIMGLLMKETNGNVDPELAITCIVTEINKIIN